MAPSEDISLLPEHHCVQEIIVIDEWVNHVRVDGSHRHDDYSELGIIVIMPTTVLCRVVQTELCNRLYLK